MKHTKGTPIPLQSRKETALELSKRNLMLEVLHLFRWFAHTYTHTYTTLLHTHNFTHNSFTHRILTQLFHTHTILSHKPFHTHTHTRTNLSNATLSHAALSLTTLSRNLSSTISFLFPVVIGCLTFLSVFYSFSSTIPQLSPIGGWSLAANE